jgi:hypothetical protein
MKTEIPHKEIEKEELGIIKKLAESLGLGRQAEKADCPFPVIPMQPIELFTYGVICRKRTKIEEYDAQLIPLDCLQAYKHAKDSGLFFKFEIWSVYEVSINDPVIVGYSGTEAWNEKPCIIARWGNELLPLQVLIPEAKKIVADVVRKKKRLLKERLEDLEEFINTDSTTLKLSSDGVASLIDTSSYHINQIFPSIDA